MPIERSGLFLSGSVAPHRSGEDDGLANSLARRSQDHVFAYVPVPHALRERCRGLPLKGARIGMLCPASDHFTALAELLKTMGAAVRYAAEGPGDIRDMAAFRDAGGLLFANESPDAVRYWQIACAILDWPERGMPDLVVDYDGRVARLVHRGIASEADVLPPAAAPDEAEIDRVLPLLRRADRPSFGAIATNIIGLSVCTASAASAMRRTGAAGGLLFPVIDVSLGRSPAPHLDPDHLAIHTLAGLLARLALVQIELFANGASYPPSLHGFPKSLADDFGAAGEVPPTSRMAS
jgi:S-adenosylhomocysteine hydrolase